MSYRSRRQREYDRFTLARYAHFRTAAEHVAAALGTNPVVKRVALFGSVASGPRNDPRRRHGTIHEPKDVDLAVWLDDTADLNALRLLRSSAVNQLWHEDEVGVAHHQVDVFLIDAATGDYLGRLCCFNQCPKHKPECRAHNCGKIAFLRQHDDFVFDRRALDRGRIEVLYERNPANTDPHATPL